MADVKQIEINGVTYDIHDATAREQIANLQQSVSQLCHRIYSREYYNTSITLSYTGANYAIPAGSTYFISACANYNHGDPKEIALSSSSDDMSLGNTLAYTANANRVCACGVTGGTATTFYVGAKYGNNSSNEIIFEGGYIPVYV